VVYAWTNELNLAFATLDSVTKTPFGIYYGELKLNPIWEPLRKDPRFVCEVVFAEWTLDGDLRQTTFLGWRDDKTPTEIVVE
jgi:ATP-dependent DNA ligase